MPDVPTSLHLRNVNELLLRVPVKHGFVEQHDIRVSYATRLRKVLTLLFGLSQDAAERSLLPAKNFVDTLHNIYHFNYGVSDDLQQSQLILSATFDSKWETYFHNLVDKIGPFLDTVFCHCRGFEGRSCADGYEAFADFIREHQVQTGMLYSVAPELTTDDLRTMKRTRIGVAPVEPGVSEETEQQILSFDQQQWSARYRSNEWQNEAEYKRLRLLSLERFFRSVWELRQLFPSNERIDGWRSAQDVYDDAAKLLADALRENAIALDAGYLAEAASNALLMGRIDPQERVDALQWFVRLDLVPAVAAIDLLKQWGFSAEAAAAMVVQQRVFKPAPAAQVAPDTRSVQVDILDETGSNEAVLTLAHLPTRNRRKFLQTLRAALDGALGLHVNVAITYDGLRRLGLEAETLELFPKEFQEGMRQRGPAFGDFGWPNHADYWCLRGQQGAAALNTVDLVITFHRKRDKAAKPIQTTVKAILSEWLKQDRDGCIVHMEVLGGNEPFKLVHPDPANQPTVKPYHALPPIQYTNEIATGDVVLGHADHRGCVAGFASDEKNPASSVLFRNGTFLVVRKLAQNVQAYLDYVKRFDAKQHETLGAPRDKSVPYDGVPDEAYPRNSHLRRSNPRRPGSPRIVRRSFSYSGAPLENDNGAAVGEQGHMFMCYNASIAEQYEVIQRWINGGNSTGLLSSKTDLIAGQHVPQPLAEQATSVPHVTVRWGLYAFVPSKVSLEKLAELTADQVQDTPNPWPKLRDAEERVRVCRGRKLMSDLDAIKDPEVARQSWKQLFETREYDREARAVWAAIRANGGRKQTPYGFLVADAIGAEEVLSNDSRFSAIEYHKRFKATGFDFYLGSDRTQCPHRAGAARSYETMAAANAHARAALSSEQLFEDARHSVDEYLAQMVASAKKLERSVRFDVRDLARWVVGEICNKHIGVPRNEAARPATLSKFLDHFVDITRYSSFPHPETSIVQRAIDAGFALRRAYDRDNPNELGLGKKLTEVGYGSIDPAALRDAIIIANVGFVPPALSMLTFMLTKWLDNGDIAHPQLRQRDHAYAAVIRELRQDSTFTTMYRTALEGNGLTSAGAFVVVGIQSAMADDIARGVPHPERWMFGGEYGQTAHGCPMRNQALHVLTGVVMGLADHVQKEACQGLHLTGGGPLTYRFENVRRVLPGQDRAAPR